MKIKVKVKPSASRNQNVTGSSISYSKFPVTGRPSFTDKLKFPEDITELTAANVSELLGKYTLLWSYVNQDRARLEVQLLRLQRLDSLRVNQMLRDNHRLNHIDKWRRDAVIAEDEQMETLKQQISSVQAELKYASMYLENYDRYANALSRELTRKTHEMPMSAKY
jgi:hypothetical protein